MSVVRRSLRAITVLLSGLVGLAICAAVTVWALARPDADPVGTGLTRAAGWLTAHLPALDTAPTPDWRAAAFVVSDGDPRRGAMLIARYGCGACHTIPGIPRARGSVGPDLTGWRDQSYIAGVLPNRPGDLVNWLQSPPRHAPETVMPDMGITEPEAEHMAAYLYTLGR